MLYYSNEARTSHIKRITELISVINTIPTNNVGGTQNATDIIKYLNEYRNIIEKEMEDK